MPLPHPSAAAGESTAEREMVITRVFEAPARLLFLAHSTPEHLMQWFGPAGYPLGLAEQDFRVGGTFRLAMKDPAGGLMAPFGGTYREILPHRKIVYDNGFLAPGSPRMLVTLTFEERGGKTTLTMHTLFNTSAERDDHVHKGFREGVLSGLDNLERHVRTLNAAP